jgi:hypothetical protein
MAYSWYKLHVAAASGRLEAIRRSISAKDGRREPGRLARFSVFSFGFSVFSFQFSVFGFDNGSITGRVSRSCATWIQDAAILIFLP